jgi:hypothetical protein
MEEKPPAVGEKGKEPEPSLGRRRDAWLPEAVRRALFIGAGTLLLTEEGIRKVLGEFNLPRELVSYVVRQSEKSKGEILAIVQKEINRFLSRIDATRIAREVLEGVSFEFQGKVTIRRKDLCGDSGAGAPPQGHAKGAKSRARS